MARQTFAAIIAALLMAPLLEAQQIQTYTDPSNNNGCLFVSYGTLPEIERAVGQTFVAPAGPIFLSDFSFWIRANDFPYRAFLQYNAFLYAWGGSGPTGPALYTSSLVNGVINPDYYSQTTFTTGSVPLVGGASYVAFVSSVLGTNTPPSQQCLNMSTTDVYSGGSVVVRDVGLGNTLQTVLSGPWLTFAGDFEFQANFTATPTTVIPEPATLGLFAMGLIGLAIVSRRRCKPA